MSFEAFAKTVGLAQPAHLKRLVRNGHMPATEMHNPKTKAMQLYITAADAQVFYARFVTLRTLAKNRGVTWQKLSAVLREKGVMPFSPEGIDYGNLYLRAEAEAAV
ncbi:MAG: hypothetical protein KGI94_03050 [Paracoccaceae bacterium]|nr:hypothetical protein [Paracoccaceae bacterium]